MASKLFQPLLLSLLGLFLALVSTISDGGGHLVVYWAQNGNEGRLTDTCATGRYNIVNIAFLSTFGSGRTPQINLTGHCPNNGCQMVRTDIRNCQNQDITVLLSIGGANTTYYGLASADDARTIYGTTFSGVNQIPDPSVMLSWMEWISTLKEAKANPSICCTCYEVIGEWPKFREEVAFNCRPQCSFPDTNLNGAISTRLFDCVWVQFYNKFCQYSTNPNGFKSAWGQWNNIPAKRIFVGLPGFTGSGRRWFCAS